MNFSSSHRAEIATELSAGRIHHVMRCFSAENCREKRQKVISVHDVLEPLKLLQALLASRDVMTSSQIFGSKLQRVFTLGDGWWLPKLICAKSGVSADSRAHTNGVVRQHASKKGS